MTTINKLVPSMVPEVLATGDPARVDEPIPAKFKVGDDVRVISLNNEGHNRLPGYIRGKKGKVTFDHGVFVFPDTSAHHLGPKPQHVYTVKFESSELWGPQGRKGDVMHADVWDDYMVLAK
jgi:nitrile hydratase subunit beta